MHIKENHRSRRIAEAELRIQQENNSYRDKQKSKQAFNMLNSSLMQKANSNYVKALFNQQKTITHPQMLFPLVEDLTVVSEGYTENPPAVYATDKKWPETVDKALTIAVIHEKNYWKMTSKPHTQPSNLCETFSSTCTGETGST